MSVTWKDLGDAWLVEDPRVALGWNVDELGEAARELRDYLHLQLSVFGLEIPGSMAEANSGWNDSLLSSLREKNRLLTAHRPAIDHRVER
ncbi:MAG: hypothetical protein D6753_05255, partial [Planctomycetota bacterium]